MAAIAFRARARLGSLLAAQVKAQARPALAGDLVSQFQSLAVSRPTTGFASSNAGSYAPSYPVDDESRAQSSRIASTIVGISPEVLSQHWINDLNIGGDLEEPKTIGDGVEEVGVSLMKRTWQPSVIRRKRKHGFLKKISTHNGRKTLNRRREKGRLRIVNI